MRAASALRSQLRRALLEGVACDRVEIIQGPPGTGKTMLARAIAGEAQVPFFALTLATLESKWHGESVKLLEAAFRLARRVQPCILFFDEIDGMIRRRSGLDDSHVYAFKTQFLMHMDGVRKRVYLSPSLPSMPRISSYAASRDA